MAKVAVYKEHLFNPNSGASITEVLLAMAIIAIAMPFVYNQISESNDLIKDIHTAHQITSIRDDALNFVRLKQPSWPDVAQIQLSSDEMGEISNLPKTGFVDQYTVSGAKIADIYLVFETGHDLLRANRIAQQIGDDAAIVGPDGVAYSKSWAVSGPAFATGDLVYKISRDTSNQDMSRFLHRGAQQDDLNVMQRDLNMGGYDVYNVGGISASSAQIRNGSTTFATAQTLEATNVYFSDGANIDGNAVEIGSLRATGDISGFRNIQTNILNSKKHTTDGHIIADRATISNSINVSHNLVLKSSSSKTISAFTGISANSVVTPFISSDELMFYNNYGLTISGELLVSSTAPLKIGSWSFPSTTPPKFTHLEFTQSAIPDLPDAQEFKTIMSSGWQSASPKAIQ